MTKIIFRGGGVETTYGFHLRHGTIEEKDI